MNFQKFSFIVIFFMINVCFGQTNVLSNQTAWQQLDKKILKYPFDIDFFENQVVQQSIKKTIPLPEQKLIKNFLVQNPIQVVHLSLVNNYIFIVNTCKPHDCDRNNLSLYLTRDYYGNSILIAYFYETAKEKMLEKWFTPLASCNIIKNVPEGHKKSEKEQLIAFKERLKCLNPVVLETGGMAIKLKDRKKL